MVSGAHLSVVKQIHLVRCLWPAFLSFTPPCGFPSALELSDGKENIWRLQSWIPSFISSMIPCRKIGGCGGWNDEITSSGPSKKWVYHPKRQLFQLGGIVGLWWSRGGRRSCGKWQVAIGLKLVGGWATPLKNISQLGWLFPIYGKIKIVPNHQPVKHVHPKSWNERWASSKTWCKINNEVWFWLGSPQIFGRQASPKSGSWYPSQVLVYGDVCVLFSQILLYTY